MPGRCIYPMADASCVLVELLPILVPKDSQTVQTTTFSTSSNEPPLWHGQLALAACIFAACMAGIFSRPVGFLASFWPANAIMLGLLLRHPAWARSASTWAIALLTYISADLLTGASAFVAVILNIANVAGVWVGWLFLHRQSSEVLHFQRQRSVLVVFTGCLLASLSCMAVGAWPGSIAFNLPLWRSFILWFSSEFYNYILLIPVFLASPKGWLWQWKCSTTQRSLANVLPLLALLVSEAMSLLIGGPGAIAFIMPAMVWCAIAYGVFPTTVLSLLVCSWKAASLFIASDAFGFAPSNLMESTSYRTGLALLSLAPLAVACAYSLRTQALRKLNHAVNHDFLTGVLARRALMERGQKLLTRLEEEGQQVAMLMVDIDHFKTVNDRYGHSQGDVVLQEFAVLARDALRPEDLIGRMGGEEFAIMLPRTTHDQALQVGQRLCERLREHVFPLPTQGQMRITLSVGMHSVSCIGPQDSMEHLLSKADEALYVAKNSGRDQVRQYGPALAPSAI